MVYIHKNFQTRVGDNAVWGAIRIFTICTPFTLYQSIIRGFI